MPNKKQKFIQGTNVPGVSVNQTRHLWNLWHPEEPIDSCSAYDYVNEVKASRSTCYEEHVLPSPEGEEGQVLLVANVPQLLQTLALDSPAWMDAFVHFLDGDSIQAILYQDDVQAGNILSVEKKKKPVFSTLDGNTWLTCGIKKTRGFASPVSRMSTSTK